MTERCIPTTRIFGAGIIKLLSLDDSGDSKAKPGYIIENFKRRNQRSSLLTASCHYILAALAIELM